MIDYIMIGAVVCILVQFVRWEMDYRRHVSHLNKKIAAIQKSIQLRAEGRGAEADRVGEYHDDEGNLLQ